MKVLSFLNNKGGVGKTASVVNLAHILATVHEKRVLVIDLDPQGNCSNFFNKTDFVSLIRAHRMGIKEERLASVGDLLIDSELDIHKVVKDTDYERVKILPSYPTLSAIEEKLKADIKTPQQFRLTNHLQKIQEEYDYCLIDCSPSLSILNINALVASDEVYIPTLVDDGSLFGIELTKTELIDAVRKYSPKLKIGGIFFTRFKDHLNASKYSKELLGKFYEKLILPITIHENTAVSDCTHNHAALLEFNKRCRAAKDYQMLAGYIVAPNRKIYLKKLQEQMAAEKIAELEQKLKELETEVLDSSDTAATEAHEKKAAEYRRQIAQWKGEK